MRPADTARQLCASLGLDFEAELAEALRVGVVFSSPTAFLLAREIPEQEMWMIDLAVGDMSEFFRVEPPGPPKKWVAFRRGDTTSVHPYTRIKRLCLMGSSAKAPPPPPPSPAPVRADTTGGEQDAMRAASRRKGLRRTIMEELAPQPLPGSTLGTSTALGQLGQPPGA